MAAASIEINDDSLGYDVELIDETLRDNVTCTICLLILKEPVQAAPCGHRFCGGCIQKLRKQTPNKPLTCPEDRQPMKVFRDNGRKREILDLIIKCTNDKCEWKGEIRGLKVHLSKCDWQLIACSSECGRKDILRQNMESHLNNECLVLLACKYAPIGCGYEGQTTQLSEHITKDFDQHLTLQMEKQEQQEKEIKKLNNSIDQLRKEVAKQAFHLPRCPFTWKIDPEEFSKAKNEDRKMTSPKFVFLGNYTAIVDVYPNGCGNGKNTHISIYFKMIKGPFDCILTLPITFKKIEFKLIINGNLVENFRIQELILKSTRTTHQTHGTTEWCELKKLPNYLKISDIKIIVDVE